MRNILYLVTLSTSLICLPSYLFAEDPYVPESLEPWVDWVLEEHPYISCPVSSTTGQRLDCLWVREVSVEINRDSKWGANFRIEVDAFADSELQLPYAGSAKPQSVKRNEQFVPIGGGSGAPNIMVPAGRHTIVGELVWTEASEPGYVEIPSAGVIRLQSDGDWISNPTTTEEGTRLWLVPRTVDTKTEPEDPSEPTVIKELDTVTARVFRLWEDGVPQTLTTFIQLTVSGQPRIIELGKVLTSEFQPKDIKSDRPVIMSIDGNVAVQAIRGQNYIEIEARALTHLDTFTYMKPSILWPIEEVWGMVSNSNHRVIQFEGGVRTNLAELNVPRQMMAYTDNISGFILTENDELKVVELQRGNTTQTPPNFEVYRDLWLNFSGTSFIAHDEVYTSLDAPVRVSASYTPGTVKVDGDIRPITYEDPAEDARAGVYLKDSTTELISVSEIERSNSLHANGWNVDADHLSVSLQLPPGWMLLWTNGVDTVENSWLSNWKIWEIFLVILLIGVVFWIGGLGWAAVVGIAAVLSIQFDSAPAIGWLILAVMTIASAKVTTEWLKKSSKWVYWTIFAIVGIVCSFHIVGSLKNALYPGSSPANSTFAELVERQAEKLVLYDATEEMELVTTGSRFSTTREYLGDDFAIANLGKQIQHPLAETSSTSPVRLPTGPGIPDWDWNTYQLNWSGSVSQDQMMSLTLLPPIFNRILQALSGLLTLGVLGFFVSIRYPCIWDSLPKFLSNGVKVLPVIVLCLILIPNKDVYAEFPERELLQELESRLLELPDCLNDCAYVENAVVEIENGTLNIDLRLHTMDTVAVPLPISEDSWSPETVASSANSRLPLLRSNNQYYTVLDEGIHQVTISATINNLDRFEIDFPLVPGNVKVSPGEWLVEGMVRDQLERKRLFFDRNRSQISMENTEENDSGVPKFEISPYVSVSRTLVFDYEPRIQTVVSRIAPYSGEFTVRIPLLENEIVESRDAILEQDHVVLSFHQNQQTQSWESKFEPDSQFVLTAPDLEQRTERWTLIGSDYWSYSYSGLKPIFGEMEHEVFVPRSLETLSLAIFQPRLVDGNTFTIEHINYSATVNERTTDSWVEMEIHASQPGDLALKLPEDTEIKSISAGGSMQPIPNSNEILIPIRSGTWNYEVLWASDQGGRILNQLPSVSLADQSARNIELEMSLPSDRWTLLLGGPTMGTSVAYWGLVSFLLVSVFVLTRIPNFPLNFGEGALLVTGTTLVNVMVLPLVAIWFFLLRWRLQANRPVNRPVWYSISQVLFASFVVAVLSTLVFTITHALSGDPNMYITGLSSDSSLLQWFADETMGSTPTAWVISLPKWVYLMIMLGWSIWLVIALLKWSKLSWQAFSDPVVWPKFDRSQSKKSSNDTQKVTVTVDPK